MELKFKFSPATMDQISILMFIGKSGMHDGTSDHMAVSFVKGFIMLTWNLGAGPRRIFTSRPIEKDKEEYLVKLGRSERRAWLAVEGLGNVTGRSKGKFVQLDVVPMLYLGGYDSLYFSTLPHDLPLHTGFEGCIFDVELKAGSVVIPLQSSRHALGRAIGQCGISECHENSCQNGGICLHHASTFSCLCQDGWFGPLCSLQYNPCDETRHNCSSGSVCVPYEDTYECNCPFGKTGKFCQNNNELTDITFSGKRSFLSLIAVDLIPTKFDIQFELRPLSEMGLVLYIGSNGKSFFSLSIQSGFLELRTLPANRIQTTKEVLILRSRKLLAKGNWYNVRVGQFGRKLYVAVENITNTVLLERNDHLKLSGDLIFLGGLADMSELPTVAVATLPIPYTGCLRRLKIDTKPIDFNFSTVKISQNVDDCDGTPCGGDYCKNNGICWLDSQLKPHCSCTKFYGGSRCENPVSCQEKGCRNGGKCVNYGCNCVMGFSGAFCETATKVTTPEFMGNSYIILKKIDKKRDLGKIGVKSLYINFTTADKNGLIFWGSKHENFVGIGIEGGHLKLAYTIKNGNRTIIEIPETESLADGIWHTLEISFGKTNLLVKIDGKIVLSQNQSNFVADLFDLSDGVLYLGGLPTEKNETIWQKTHNMFHAYFKGCIKAFGINNILAVTDFSHYDGSNIGICNVI
ncbi:protein eyes shut-like [Agrilus planipennis]|nr:protein eyes shut-like [Agrilus planipennis]